MAQTFNYYNEMQKNLDKIFNNSRFTFDKAKTSFEELGLNKTRTNLLLSCYGVLAYGEGMRLLAEKHNIPEELYKAAIRIHKLGLEEYQFNKLVEVLACDYDLGDKRFADRVYNFSILISQMSKRDLSQSTIDKIVKESNGDTFYSNIGNVKRTGKVKCKSCGKMVVGYKMAKGKVVCAECERLRHQKSRATENGEELKKRSMSYEELAEASRNVVDEDEENENETIERLQYYLDEFKKMIISEAVHLKNNKLALDKVCNLIEEIPKEILKEALQNVEEK